MVKARSMLSSAMKSSRVNTNSNTMRGRMLDASHEPLALSEVHLCDLVLQLETLCDEVEQLFVVFTRQARVLVDDALQHTKSALIWQKVSDEVEYVGCFALEPRTDGRRPDFLLVSIHAASCS